MNITRKEFYGGVVAAVVMLLGAAHTAYVTDTQLANSIAKLYLDMVGIDIQLVEKLKNNKVL